MLSPSFYNLLMKYFTYKNTHLSSPHENSKYTRAPCMNTNNIVSVR